MGALANLCVGAVYLEGPDSMKTLYINMKNCKALTNMKEIRRFWLSERL